MRIFMFGHQLKPRPNDRNMPTQHIATLLGATCCAQQCCDMLRWHVAIVWPGLNFLRFSIKDINRNGFFKFGLKFVRHCQMVSSATAIYTKMISLRIQPPLPTTCETRRESLSSRFARSNGSYKMILEPAFEQLNNFNFSFNIPSTR